jgi:hypothetical protein
MREPDRPGLVVAHGLGSGKTLSSIATQDSLGLAATILVPASLQSNYEKERTKHIVGTSPEAIITSLQRIALHDSVPLSPLAIVDEAHRAREINTKTYKALRKGLEPVEKRMLLTASPFYNRPSDIASLINLAANDRVLEADPTTFKSKYVKSRKVSPGFFNRLRGIKPGVVEEINPAERKNLQKVFRRWVDYHPGLTEGFPAVEREVVKVPMTSGQLRMYDTVIGKAPRWVAAKVRAGLPPSKQESRQLNAFATAVRQISLSTREHAPGKPPEEPKVEAAFQNMKSMLGSSKRAKGVAYSNYLGVGIAPYRERLERAGIPYGEFTGQMNKKERDRLVQEYNEGKKRVLLVSSAGGEGLDLKGTRLIQVLEPHWNAEKLKQVEGRAIRYKSHDHLPSKERKVLVQNYLATRPKAGFLEKLKLRVPGLGIDEYLVDRSEDKERLIEQFRELLGKREMGIQG